MLEALRPLVRSLARLLKGASPATTYEVQELARILRALGSHGDPVDILERYRLLDEDLEEEISAIILELLCRYKPKASFATYITKYVRWRLMTHIQRAVEKTVPTVFYGSATVPEERAKAGFDLLLSIDELDTWEKTLVSSRLHGMSVRDIANNTLMPKSTVHNDLSRIRRRLNG